MSKDGVSDDEKTAKDDVNQRWTLACSYSSSSCDFAIDLEGASHLLISDCMFSAHYVAMLLELQLGGDLPAATPLRKSAFPPELSLSHPHNFSHASVYGVPLSCSWMDKLVASRHSSSKNNGHWALGIEDWLTADLQTGRLVR